MTWAGVVVRNALAARARVALTIVGVALAAATFGFLRTAIDAYYAGVDAAARDRLVVRHASSMGLRLPVAYGARIAAVDGVQRVAAVDFFGGIYKEPKYYFANLAVDDGFLDVYPEYRVAPAERAAYAADPAGCVAGEKLARMFGWHVGDRIVLKGTYFAGDWPLTIRAIYHPRDAATMATQLFFHHRYLDDGVPAEQKDQAGAFVVTVTDSGCAAQIAAAIDARLAGGAAPTLSESERSFQLLFISMAGQLLTVLRAVSGFMLVLLGLALANAMATAVRERTGELAVMKALGFRGRRLAAMIAAEGALIGAAGGALGLGLCALWVRLFASFMDRNLGAFFPIFALRGATMLLLVGGALAIGAAAAGLPAWRASRIAVAHALRRVG